MTNEPAERGRVLEVGLLFVRLGATAFGGPAAHVAMMERECVRARGWITREQFLDVLGVANLIPGPTSTELAMHIGRQRAGWAGLVAAGLGFVAPAVAMVAAVAAVYVRAGDLPLVRGVLLAVGPVVLVVILDALLPLARAALQSVQAVAIGLAAVLMVLLGTPEIAVLLIGGLLHLGVRSLRTVVPLLLITATLGVQAGGVGALPGAGEVFGYFARVGALLFGSGYVLLPVLEGDLVERYGWLTGGQLLDAIAVGQATPGPVFTTATFIGYVMGGPWIAAAATAGMFLPAFVFASVSSVMLDRLRRSASVRAFLDGVNAAAVALIALVLVSLGEAALTGAMPIAIAAVAAVLLFVLRVSGAWLLPGAAVVGAVYSFAQAAG